MLLFELCAEHFAVPVASVLRVTRPVTIRRIPHRTNRIIRGIGCVEGELLICVDLSNLLEVGDSDERDHRVPEQPEHQTADRRRLIVVGEATRSWAAEVDAVAGVIRTDPTTYQMPPLTVEHALKRYTASLLPHGDGLVSLLDLQAHCRGIGGSFAMSGDLSNFSMFELFKDEAKVHTAVLSDGLLAWEANPADFSQVEMLMCAAHSVKGAGRIVNIDPVVELAHSMEDCFVAVQKGAESLTSARVDQLLAAVDLLRGLAELPEAQLAEWVEAHGPAANELGEMIRQPVAERDAAGIPPEEPTSTAPMEVPAEVPSAALESEHRRVTEGAGGSIGFRVD